jgi:hypothetical protein
LCIILIFFNFFVVARDRRLENLFFPTFNNLLFNNVVGVDPFLAD